VNEDLTLGIHQERMADTAQIQAIDHFDHRFQGQVASKHAD
jgi:hypothetical protein